MLYLSYEIHYFPLDFIARLEKMYQKDPQCNGLIKDTVNFGVKGSCNMS